MDSSTFIHNIFQTAKELHLALRQKALNIKPTLHISWEAPPSGFMKMNTDGAAQGNPGVAGAGGILRGPDGVWLCGFRAHLGIC